jgi:hypothetical protein
VKIKSGILKVRGNLKLNKKPEAFRLPFLSLDGIAALSGLTRDTVFQLAQKGVLNPEWREGKMVFKRKEIDRWLRESA